MLISFWCYLWFGDCTMELIALKFVEDNKQTQFLSKLVHQLTFCSVDRTRSMIRSTCSFILCPWSCEFISEDCISVTFSDSGEVLQIGSFTIESTESLLVPGRLRDCFRTRTLSMTLLQRNCTFSTNSSPLFSWKDSLRSLGKFEALASSRSSPNGWIMLQLILSDCVKKGIGIKGKFWVLY